MKWPPDLDTPGHRVYRAGYEAGYADCMRDYNALLTNAYTKDVSRVTVKFARALFNCFVETRRKKA